MISQHCFHNSLLSIIWINSVQDLSHHMVSPRCTNKIKFINETAVLFCIQWFQLRAVTLPSCSSMMSSMSLRNVSKLFPEYSRFIPRGRPRHEQRLNFLRLGHPSKSDLQEKIIKISTIVKVINILLSDHQLMIEILWKFNKFCSNSYLMV